MSIQIFTRIILKVLYAMKINKFQYINIKTHFYIQYSKVDVFSV